MATAALRYRPDIDSLRALAVSVVVLFHAAPELFPGGFLGVDVFFVISGFLITAILTAEIDQGRFSFIGFWERRARRLGPAAIVVILFVSAVVLLFRPPDAVKYFGESVSHCVLLLSDLFYYNESDYFGKDAHRQPLLHFWSLAVEAKFYIVFPLLFFLASRFGAVGRWALISIVGAASFLACLAYVERDPSAAFFLPMFRAWEFMLGAGLALAAQRGASPPVSARQLMLRDIVLVASSVCLVASVFLVSEASAHPGWPTILAVAPTLAALWAGRRSEAEATVVWRAVTAPPVVALGLVSYSLYLWHWPLLVFARDIAQTPLPLAATLIALGLAAVLSLLSYRYVESRYRRAPPRPVVRSARSRRGFALSVPVALWRWRAPLAFCVAVLLGGGFLQSSKGWPGRFSDEALSIVDPSRTKRGVVYLRCPSVTDPTDAARNARPAGATLCRLGAPGAPISVAIWGDSHGDALSPAIDAYLRQAGAAGVVSVKGACGPFLGFAYDQRENRASCRAINEGMPAYLRALGVETVVFVANWDGWRDELRKQAFTSLQRSIAALGPQVKQILLATPVPLLDYEAAPRLFLGHLLGLAPPPPLPSADYDARLGDVVSRFEAMAAADPRIVLLQTHRALCGPEHCFAYQQGDGTQPDLPLYADKSHLNAAAADALAPHIRAAFRDGRKDP